MISHLYPKLPVNRLYNLGMGYHTIQIKETFSRPIVAPSFDYGLAYLYKKVSGQTIEGILSPSQIANATGLHPLEVILIVRAAQTSDYSENQLTFFSTLAKLPAIGTGRDPTPDQMERLLALWSRLILNANVIVDEDLRHVLRVLEGRLGPRIAFLADGMYRAAGALGRLIPDELDTEEISRLDSMTLIHFVAISAVAELCTTAISLIDNPKFGWSIAASAAGSVGELFGRLTRFRALDAHSPEQFGPINELVRTSSLLLSSETAVPSPASCL